MNIQTNQAMSALSPKESASARPLHNLRSPGLLGRWPVIGLIMVLVGGSLFGLLAFNLQTNGPLIQYDPQISNSLHIVALHSSPFIREVMIFGFFMGEYMIIAIGFLLAIYFVHKRFWLEFSMVLIAWAGEGALWLTLSNYYHRARPVFEVPIGTPLEVPGFPSGHSLSAVMCYGLLAYLIAPRMASRLAKIVVVTIAGLIILYIGFSRIFVGDHYLTDVLAGFGLGIAWSGFVYTGLEVLARRLRKRPAVTDLAAKERKERKD